MYVGKDEEKVKQTRTVQTDRQSIFSVRSSRGLIYNEKGDHGGEERTKTAKEEKETQ